MSLINKAKPTSAITTTNNNNNNIINIRKICVIMSKLKILRNIIIILILSAISATGIIAALTVLL